MDCRKHERHERQIHLEISDSGCAMDRFRSKGDEFSLGPWSGGTALSLPGICGKWNLPQIFLDELHAVLCTQLCSRKKVKRMANVSALSPFIILSASFTTPSHNYPAAALNFLLLRLELGRFSCSAHASKALILQLAHSWFSSSSVTPSAPETSHLSSMNLSYPLIFPST